jgi:multidrug efflux pump subunit AcrA (membrane-fusion protein)
VLLLLILGAGYWYMRSRGAKTQDATGASGKAGGRRGAGGAIPVAIATVKKGNIGEYINAIGIVTPVATVTLQSRVTGQLMEISYKEGQIVQKGALLAKIDPRPYEAAVTQAQGQLERDQAIRPPSNNTPSPNSSSQRSRRRSIRTRAPSSWMKATWPRRKSTLRTRTSSRPLRVASVCAPWIRAISFKPTETSGSPLLSFSPSP